MVTHRIMQKQAQWIVCGDMSEWQHAQLSFCPTCAPFDGKYPVCPVHQLQLNAKGYAPCCSQKFNINGPDLKYNAEYRKRHKLG